MPSAPQTHMTHPLQSFELSKSKRINDRFKNEIDASVGYARGTVLGSSIDEALRLRQGQRLATARVRALGPHSVSVFTGNQRDFPIRAEDLTALCEEWVGPGVIADELHAIAVEHMGGEPTDHVAVFNRTSAGIIAAIAALSERKPVVSFVPLGGRSHASVIRGCSIGGSEFVEVDRIAALGEALVRHGSALVVITTVTSSLESLPQEDIQAAIELSHRHGAVAFLDDAYGARIRPVLHGGKRGLELGADISITNCDKAGLCGPRAGVVVGRLAVVTKVQAKGAEFGMEARAPIIVGAMRSLQSYSPEMLLEEAHSGKELSIALSAALGARVGSSDLGPVIDENDLLEILLELAGGTEPVIVPAEASAALGMVLLRDHGILTTNTHGQPGARVSLRLKPTLDALPRIGGVPNVVEAVRASFIALAPLIGDVQAISNLVTGAQV